MCYIYCKGGRKSRLLYIVVHCASIRDALCVVCVCIFSVQFDFSIFDESVRPQFSAAGEKKFPLIRPTYEVSGVPDMFIGRQPLVVADSYAFVD